MKRHIVYSLLVSLLLTQCTPPQPFKEPKIDFDQASIDLMNELAPQIVGTWTLRQIDIKHSKDNYYQKQAQITKDTTFVNFATLSITPAAIPRSSPRDLRRGEYDGTIEFKGKSYPIQFELLASAGWIVNKTGPQTSFLFEYRFPIGGHLVEPEEAYLKNIGLVGDNFTMEITNGKPTMIWRGLGRGVARIELVRK